jgi:hypothetical protein
MQYLLKVWYYYKRTIKYFQTRLEVIHEISKDSVQVFLAVVAAEFFTRNGIDMNRIYLAAGLTLLFSIFTIISYKKIKYV